MTDPVSPSFLPIASIAFAGDSWWWVSLLFGFAALVFLVAGYRRSPLRGGWKGLAMLLKMTGLALMALALMEPVWIDRFPKKGANDLVLLVDNSRGLSVTNPATGDPIGADLRDSLQLPESGIPPGWLSRLDETFRRRNYLFDRRIERTGDDFAELAFDGDASSLLTSLRSVRDRFARRPLAATIVFTDGNATASENIDEVLAALAEPPGESRPTTPVFPVLVGQPVESAHDLGIRSVVAKQSAFEDAPLTLVVEASALGKVEGPVEVFARNAREEEVGVEPVALPPGANLRSTQVRLRLPAALPGVSFYRVGIRHQGDDVPVELTSENNERLVSVTRDRGPYRVLYVTGRPNWEYKYLRRALAEDAEIELVALIRIAKREPKFEWRGRSGESGNPLFRGFESDIPEETRKYDEPVYIRLNTASEEELRDGFPKSEEELFPAYHAILLDDVEAEFFSAEQRDLLERFVTLRGGSVTMLGGQESFREGEWLNTPVGRMMPVYLDPAREKDPAPAFDAAFSLTREGWLEPWMRLRSSRSDEETRLAYMPGFFALNRIDAIKPGAQVLATVTDADRRRWPAIVTQRYGEGKTAAVLVADKWRWGMKDAELRKDFAKSWRQFVRWAITGVPDRVTMETRFAEGGSVPRTELTVRVRDDVYRPRDDASVRFEITRPDGETETIGGDPSLEEAGVFTATHFAGEAGGYKLQGVARDGEGAEIGTVETGWALNPAAEEFETLGPRREILDRIAEATGGEVLTLDEVGRLPGLLADLDAPVLETRQRPLWHAPWFFALALACFLGEWGLRRWKGVL